MNAEQEEDGEVNGGVDGVWIPRKVIFSGAEMVAETKALRAENERLRGAAQRAIDELVCGACTCGDAYKSRGMTALDCIPCWVASGLEILRAALAGDEVKEGR